MAGIFIIMTMIQTRTSGDGTSGDGDVFHGTFVAGVAAAVSDNHRGVVGASWHSKIMPLKVFTNTAVAPRHGHLPRRSVMPSTTRPMSLI